MSNGHGGARPGGGRPKGSISHKTKELLARVATEGITPMEVFLNDMRYFYHLGESKLRLAEETKPGKEQAKAMRQALELKSIARECAAQAAPYVHPKLTAISAPDGGPVSLNLEVTFVGVKK